MKDSMSLKVAKSIASIMAFFDWAKVVDIEKSLGYLKELDDLEALDQVKEDALQEMLHIYDIAENEVYLWSEAAHSLRYEYYKDEGFKLFYCPVVADYASE